MQNYLDLIQDLPPVSIEYRYLTLLELIGILATRAQISLHLLDQLKEYGLLTVYLADPKRECRERQLIHLSTVNLLNKMITSAKKPRSDEFRGALDAFLVDTHIVEYLFQALRKSLAKKNMFFSAVSNFFCLLGSLIFEGVIKYMVNSG
jgi:hypothetical protein